MTTIIPTEEEFSQQTHTVYYVNQDPRKRVFSGSTTTSQKCPHCGERHIYKVFDEKGYRDEPEWMIEIYDCRCPSCEEEFDLEVEHEK